MKPGVPEIGKVLENEIMDEQGQICDTGTDELDGKRWTHRVAQSVNRRHHDCVDGKDDYGHPSVGQGGNCRDGDHFRVEQNVVGLPTYRTYRTYYSFKTFPTIFPAVVDL